MHMFHFMNPVNNPPATRESSSKREENLAKVRLEKWSIVTNKPKMQVNVVETPSTVICAWILDMFFFFIWALQVSVTKNKCNCFQ